jgi:proteasome lid subunit RPN8/RPN11
MDAGAAFLHGMGKRIMLQGMVSRAQHLFTEWRSWLPPRAGGRRSNGMPAPAQPVLVHYAPLERVLLTDGVGRTLFEEYAQHRGADRGDEETGWVLLGLRHVKEAVVLATLPAGTERDAGVAHVRFNSEAQALASRIVRQSDRRLTILGVVHTHPGSLRHPSDADLRGDGQWVGCLRGEEGVFGIGTADAAPEAGAMFAYQPRVNVQCLGELRFSWYALRSGERAYRPLSVGLTIGPDLARSLHRIWPTLETHAARLDRLYRQQAGMRFAVTSEDEAPGLLVTVPLAERGGAVRVLLRPKEVRYYAVQGGEAAEVDLHEPCVDRGIYLLLAELASRA